MKLASGLQLDTTKSYVVKVADGSEPRHLIDSRDNLVVKAILSSMTRACDSEADVIFMLDKVRVEKLQVDVYSVDMYVETNTDILLDELNAIMAAYPSRVQRRALIRTTRRPDVAHLYATRVHIDITTHDFALAPARIDVCHIYSPAIPLKRNAVTGTFAVIANAGNAVRDNPREFVSAVPDASRQTTSSWTETFGSIFGGASTPSPSPREPTDFIIFDDEHKKPRPFKRPRIAMVGSKEEEEEKGPTD